MRSCQVWTFVRWSSFVSILGSLPELITCTHSYSNNNLQLLKYVEKIEWLHIMLTGLCNLYTQLLYSKTVVYRGIWHLIYFLLYVVDCGYSVEANIKQTWNLWRGSTGTIAHIWRYNQLSLLTFTHSVINFYQVK